MYVSGSYSLTSCQIISSHSSRSESWVVDQDIRHGPFTTSSKIEMIHWPMANWHSLSHKEHALLIFHDTQMYTQINGNWTIIYATIVIERSFVGNQKSYSMNILDLCMISYDSWVFYFKIIYWQQVGDLLAESASIQASTTATVADGIWCKLCYANV